LQRPPRPAERAAGFETAERFENVFVPQLPTVTVSIGMRPAQLPVVALQCAGASVLGYADGVTDSEILMQALEELPPVRGAGAAVLDFGGESAAISGAISFVDSDARLLRVSLDRIDGGGELLLAAELLPGDAEREAGGSWAEE
jgi:hypothetical protein